MAETKNLVEAIIGLPSQLFYNTDIGIYAFILSKNKRPDRRGKVQLINAVDMWKPLRKSLGKKRREIDRDSMKLITELYANFEETANCKIFTNEEFMYREYSVWQPLQRSAILNAESVEKLRTSAYFTANSSIFSEAEFEQLAEMNPRSAADEKKYQKYLAGRKFAEDVLAILEANKSDKVYMDYAAFETALKKLLCDVEGYVPLSLVDCRCCIFISERITCAVQALSCDPVKTARTASQDVLASGVHDVGKKQLCAGGGCSKVAFSGAIEICKQANARSFFRSPQGGSSPSPATKNGLRSF